MPTTSFIPPVKVDRILRDGDTIRLGDVLLTAYHTPGHTRGATTWVANLVVDGKAYVVAFPDGAGFNPGYRLAKNPSYPGIADDYRRTHHMLEMLKPDIWLAQHNEYYDLEGKRKRAETEGVNAGSILKATGAGSPARSAPSRTRSMRNWARRLRAA